MDNWGRGNVHHVANAKHHQAVSRCLRALSVGLQEVLFLELVVDGT